MAVMSVELLEEFVKIFISTLDALQWVAADDHLFCPYCKSNKESGHGKDCYYVKTVKIAMDRMLK